MSETTELYKYELDRLESELAETKRKLEEEKQRGFAMSAEIEDMLVKLEAAEQRIRESQEQEPVGIVQIYSMLGEKPSAHLSITKHGQTVLSSGEYECVYAIPPILNTEKE